MRMVDLIQKKRDGNEHTPEEIRWIIKEYTNHNIPDEQMSAWAMAVYFQGMTPNEMTEMTLSMAESGEQIDYASLGILDPIVDKHSTGGVGDKTTLFVAPWAAACGLKMGKMSGRGLGHTGGTIDKLEAIPGFQVNLSPEAFYQQIKDIGIALMGQNKKMTPADARLYALRDVTGTVPSIPLIASSIMSKKIAAGAQSIVLDVKVGKGAFMKDIASAIKLAKAMVTIGQSLGRETIAILTNMDQPLGQMIGNTLEVKEAIRVLSNQGPKDLEELGITLVTSLLMASHGIVEKEAKRITINALQNGSALRTFRTWIEKQGGDLSRFDQEDPMINAPITMELRAERSGYVSEVQSEEIGLSAMRLGAGRNKKLDEIDHRVGIEWLVRVGEWIEKDQVIAILHGASYQKMQHEREQLGKAIVIQDDQPRKSVLILARVDKDGVHLFS